MSRGTPASKLLETDSLMTIHARLIYLWPEEFVEKKDSSGGQEMLVQTLIVTAELCVTPMSLAHMYRWQGGHAPVEKTMARYVILGYNICVVYPEYKIKW